MSCIGIAFDVNASCIVSDDVDVHVNVDDYLNYKFYGHDFQSKPSSNSKNFKPEILFSVFTFL